MRGATMADRQQVKTGVRDARGRFAKGNRTGGRPGVSRDFQERCRAAMEKPGGGWDRAIEFLHGTRRETQWAIEFLAAYAYGKPRTRTEVTGVDGAPVAVEFIEVRRGVGSDD